MPTKDELLVLAIGELLRHNAHLSPELMAINQQFRDEYKKELKARVYARDFSHLRAANRRINTKPKPVPAQSGRVTQPVPVQTS